ncbi:MAG: hypothetical protein NTW87_18215 [Planctomycetota bacterium]|nr:hypothetical protein [Planctomycetota bacterium]
MSTVSGGGERTLKKGETIPALQMKFGCASRFALTPDGAVYYANYGGIFEVKDGQGKLLADATDLKKMLGEKAPLVDWHVGGSHLTPGGVFYWMPGGGPDLLRFDTRTGQAERVAGIGRIDPGLDGPTLQQSGFHTVLVVYNSEASVIYTCGGDESVPRRIAGGRVTSLHRDGVFRPFVKAAGGKDQRWREMAAVQCLDKEQRVYYYTGDYGWGGWVVRLTVADGN